MLRLNENQESSSLAKSSRACVRNANITCPMLTKKKADIRRHHTALRTKNRQCRVIGYVPEIPDQLKSQIGMHITIFKPTMPTIYEFVEVSFIQNGLFAGLSTFENCLA